MGSRRALWRVPPPKCALRPARLGASRSICIPPERSRKRCLRISKFILSNITVGALAVASLLKASPGAAHGFGQRYDLPLPLSFYLVGAAGAVVASFIIVGLFVRGGASPAGMARKFDLAPRGIGRLILHPACGLVLQLVTLVIFAVTVT